MKKTMSKWHKEAIQFGNKAEKEPVPIVSDAAVTTRVLADGRIIPVLIINTSLRPDIEDMIRAHKHIGAGDVKSAWSIPSRFDKSRISLVLTIIKPSRCVIILLIMNACWWKYPQDISEKNGTKYCKRQ